MTSTRTRIEPKFIALVLLFFAFSYAFFAIQSGDALMYLAFARDFWATHHWLTTDPYVYTLAAGSPLHVTHEYLSYLIFYDAYLLGGWGGLIVLKILILGLGWLVVVLEKERTRSLSLSFMALWSLAVLAASFRFIERSSAFSDLFCILLISWLMKARVINRTFILRVTLLFFLWVQLHPGFPLGLALLFAWTIHRCAVDAEFRSPRLFWLLLPVAVLFLNPTGIEAVFYPFEFALNEAVTLKKYNLEWLPSYHHLFRFAPETLAFWTLLLACFAIFARARKLITWRAALALFAAAAATQTVRFVPWASFALVLLTPTPEEKSPPRFGRFVKYAFATVLCAVAVKNLGWGYVGSSGARLPRAGLDPKFFPVGTEEFWRTHRIAGRLYNAHDFGAYLIWMKDTPIFHHGFVTDMNFYESEVVGVLSSPDRFFELAKKYDWTMLLVDKYQTYRYFYSVLSAHPEWKIVAEDDAAYLIYKLPDAH